MFRKFDDGEVKMEVGVRVGDIFAHAQVMMDKVAADLGGNVNVKSKVEKFGVDKPSRTPASSGVPNLSQSG